MDDRPERPRDPVRVFGRFRVLSVAGKGGMAIVYRAVAEGAGRFSRPVALKQIRPAAPGKADQLLELFVEEARVSARLDHPNIVQVHDFGQDRRGKHFLVLEWVEGIDLLGWVNARPAHEKPDWALVGAIALEVLDALDFAHRHTDDEGRPAPVYHRDVSPGNILLGLHGHAKLSDFGLARAMDRARITGRNKVKGKIAYLPPELTRGEEPTPGTDVFSLGVTLFEALTRQAMFFADDTLELLRRVRRGEAARLRDVRPDLPLDLCDVIERALEREPARRYATARAMRRDLQAVLIAHRCPPDPLALARSVADARALRGATSALDAGARASVRQRGLPARGERETLLPEVDGPVELRRRR